MNLFNLSWFFGKIPLKMGRRAKTPTVLQMEAVECGAASLGSVLGYFKRFVPLEELRAACGVSRDGSTAKNVLKAAKDYGLIAKGFKKDIEQLREIPTPAILFWNFNHFIVLEGFGKNKIYVNDPAMGPRIISEEELDDCYTGVVMVFEPEEDFKKGGKKPDLITPLLRHIKGNESGLIYAVIAGISLVPLGLAVPIFSQLFVDKYLVSGLTDWLKPLLIGMGITALLRAGLSYLQEYYLLRLTTKLSIAMSSNFFWHVLRLPYQFFTQRYAGEIGSRVALNNQVASLLSGQLASTVIDVFLAIFYGALMIVYDFGMTLLGLASIIGNIFVLKAVGRKRVDGNRRLLQDQGKLMGSFMGGLQQIFTLKATGGEMDMFQRISGYQAKVINGSQDLAEKTFVLNLAPMILTALITNLVLVLGAYRVMQGDMTMGMLVAFQSLMSSFTGPVTNLVGMGSQLQTMQGNLNRLDDVLGNEVDPQVSLTSDKDNDEENTKLRLSGKIDIEDISFGYSPLELPFIDSFSCSLPPSGKLALVGGSGSGKSTLARMICGLFPIWDGKILFDGTERNAWDRKVLTNSIALVDQDIVLFEGTIKDNLTMWDATVPDQQIINAAKDALIHEDIVSRPGGYDGAVDENGRNFSGGQRQRLEIARALVNNPKIIILDEATSALDPVTEEIVAYNIHRRGCTCIIVAHRLSTIRDCDEIVFLKDGKVSERGTHDSLMENEEGLYHQIVSVGH
tara:strand:+ start:7387 stop:9597 length:2211 start_codon:yes stop_codon:yes gene_type:complete